jgi:cell division septation protein DedD
MASGNSKGSWFIWVLFIVAAVFAFFAFNKLKPVAQPMSADQPVVAVQAPATQTAQAVQAPVAVGIKPDHSAKDMKAIAAQKPVSAVVTPPHAIAPVPSFAVQVYSFKEKTRAETALKALKDKNYKAYIMVSDLGPRGIWYRVRVGSFPTEDEAHRVLESITKDFKSGIIVTE